MIELLNLSETDIDEEAIQNTARFVLNTESKEIPELSIVFVDEKTITEVNQKYRGKNETTDVLSFNLTEDTFPKAIAQIVICPRVVKKRAQEPLERELKRVLIHGLLHILGHDHHKEQEAQEMREKENYYLNQGPLIEKKSKVKRGK